MKYSQATDYALHTMLYIVSLPTNETVGVQQLAELQELSPMYLSKIMSRLVKAGLIESTPGMKGGYKLMRNKEEISFLEVIEAIEGTTALFHCGARHDRQNCLIQEVMTNAERQMEDFLRDRRLVELVGRMGEVKALP